MRFTVYLRPRGKGRKLAWQGAWHEKHNDAEDADAAEFAAGGDMPTMSLGEGGVVNFEVSRDWRFQPPNTLLKQN